MSDLILSLPRYHKHITIYVVHTINMILGRMCLLWDFHFTLLYVVLSISTYICKWSIIKTKIKTKCYMLTWRIWISCPSLVFARETYNCVNSCVSWSVVFLQQSVLIRTRELNTNNLTIRRFSKRLLNDELYLYY